VRHQGRIFVGILVIVFGLMLLLGNLFHVDMGQFCWPVGLILLGIWLLLRPALAGQKTALRYSLFGPVRREGTWQVSEQEIWLFLGDIRLDFTQAEIPPGETEIRIFTFIGDVKVLVPEGLGVSVSSTAFISSAKVLDRKRDSFVAPVEVTTEGYETAERKVRLETLCFISDVKVKTA
jgi:predicted membrane protein